MRQLEQHHPEYVHGVLEARKIVDFRNLIIHQYSTVDDREVWSAVRAKLPEFREQMAELVEARRL